MNNKKRPAVSDTTTLTRRYSRRISTNNNIKASLDDCVDDIILSVASYLTSCELFNFALTCKRFGARSTSKVGDKQDDVVETTAILPNGSRVFSRPSSSGTTILHRHRNEGREDVFIEGVIIDYSFITDSYHVEFKSNKLTISGNSKQLIHQTEVVSIKDMTKRVEQSLTFCVKRDGDGDTISILGRFIGRSQRWGVEPSFIAEVVTGMPERVKSQLESRDWSLMEEVALKKSLSLLPKDGCLMRREGESWIGIYHRFEQELIVLSREATKLEVNPNELPTGADVDQYLDILLENTRGLENQFIEEIARRRNLINDLQRYSNVPLEECHERGASKLIGLYEIGVAGILMNQSIRKRVEIALLIAFLRSMQVPGPLIVVVPLSLIPRWIEALKQFSNIIVTCLTGTEEDREAMYSGRLNRALYQNGTKYPVIITSYEVAITDSDQLNKIGEFKHFIIDEGEGFERYRGALISSLKHYKSAGRLFLPASPINRAKDMLTLLHFIIPHWFDRDDLLSFVQYTERCDEERRHQIEAKLQSILRPFTVH